MTALFESGIGNCVAGSGRGIF